MHSQDQHATSAKDGSPAGQAIPGLVLRRRVTIIIACVLMPLATAMLAAPGTSGNVRIWNLGLTILALCGIAVAVTIQLSVSLLKAEQDDYTHRSQLLTVARYGRKVEARLDDVERSLQMVAGAVRRLAESQTPATEQETPADELKPRRKDDGTGTSN